jgi:hypothetical protein
MLELVLPTTEETQVKFTIGETTKTLDIVEVEALQQATWSEMERLGIEDTRQFFSVFSEKFQKEYSLKLSPYQVNALLNGVVHAREQLKKKYYPSQEQQDTTESNQ